MAGCSLGDILVLVVSAVISRLIVLLLLRARHTFRFQPRGWRRQWRSTHLIGLDATAPNANRIAAMVNLHILHTFIHVAAGRRKWPRAFYLARRERCGSHTEA